MFGNSKMQFGQIYKRSYSAVLTTYVLSRAVNVLSGI